MASQIPCTAAGTVDAAVATIVVKVEENAPTNWFSKHDVHFTWPHPPFPVPMSVIFEGNATITVVLLTTFVITQSPIVSSRGVVWVPLNENVSLSLGRKHDAGGVNET
jgi:hypothetical protein